MSIYVQEQRKETEDGLRYAASIIDDVFGEGYATKNPLLIGQVFNVVAREYDTDTIREQLAEIAKALDYVDTSVKCITEPRLRSINKAMG